MNPQNDRFGPDDIRECQRALEQKKAAELEWKTLVDKQQHKLRTSYKYETKKEEADKLAEKLANKTLENHVNKLQINKGAQNLRNKLATSFKMKIEDKSKLSAAMANFQATIKALKAQKLAS